MSGRVLAAVALVFLMSAAAEAQYTGIQGWVIVPTSKHPDNFEVRVTVREGDDAFASTTVGDSGRFMFTNLDLSVGSFDILVQLEGFREYRAPLIVPSGTGARVETPITGNIILIPDPENRHLTDAQDAYTDALLSEYSKGLDQITAKRPDLALTHLEKVVKEIPDFYDARINLGLVYQDLSRTGEAEAEFRKAHELNPESARPLLVLGRLLLDTADLENLAGAKQEVIQPKLNDARDVLTEALARDSSLATAFYYRGAVEFRSKSYSNAERELKQALLLDPGLYPARITLINVFVVQKLWQAALDNVDTFLLENPVSPYRAQVAATRLRVVRRLQTPH